MRRSSSPIARQIATTLRRYPTLASAGLDADGRLWRSRDEDRNDLATNPEHVTAVHEVVILIALAPRVRPHRGMSVARLRVECEIALQRLHRPRGVSAFTVIVSALHLKLSTEVTRDMIVPVSKTFRPDRMIMNLPRLPVDGDVLRALAAFHGLLEQLAGGQARSARWLAQAAHAAGKPQLAAVMGAALDASDLLIGASGRYLTRAGRSRWRLRQASPGEIAFTLNEGMHDGRGYIEGVRDTAGSLLAAEGWNPSREQLKTAIGLAEKVAADLREGGRLLGEVIEDFEHVGGRAA